MKIVVSKAKYRIYLQKDDVGIKLKLLGLNSLTIPSGVAKLWTPNFFDLYVCCQGHCTLGLGRCDLCVIVYLEWDV